jgi:hypothetical protein
MPLEGHNISINHDIWQYNADYINRMPFYVLKKLIYFEKYSSLSMLEDPSKFKYTEIALFFGFQRLFVNVLKMFKPVQSAKIHLIF